MTKCQQETRQSLKDPARRDLIAGAAGAVGLVVFGGFICHSNVSEASLVRPPGSRPEAEFLPAAFAATDAVAPATPMP